MKYLYSRKSKASFMLLQRHKCHFNSLKILVYREYLVITQWIHEEKNTFKKSPKFSATFLKYVFVVCLSLYTVIRLVEIIVYRYTLNKQISDKMGSVVTFCSFKRPYWGIIISTRRITVSVKEIMNQMIRKTSYECLQEVQMYDWQWHVKW